MKNWLNFNFWFDVKSGNSLFFNKILLFVAAGLMVISFLYLTLMAVLFKNSKAYAILREHIFYFLFLSGFLLVIAWFFRYQQIAYLGARITLVIVFLIIAGWIIYLLAIIKKVFLPTLAEERDWQRKEKYFPKAKKRI
jgi:hypothetical protein